MPLQSTIAPHLPLLRRYARSLVGNQADGDACVRRTLERIVADPAAFPDTQNPRLALYKMFQDVWNAEGGCAPDDPHADSELEEIARSRLSLLSPLSRQALLLSSVEGFPIEDVAYVLDVEAETATSLVEEAQAEIDRQTRARVLIIEDEPMIALDLENLLKDLGHKVVAIAVTRDEAVGCAITTSPTLILADVQLADDSSGIDAVRLIMERTQMPVIFITAFPERLLTGERPEPAFLITKPFSRDAVRAAVAQALFFDKATLPT